MSRFKITMDFKAEDLDPDTAKQKDDGNVAHFENASVGEETRHRMQKSLMELFASWGENYLGKQKR